MRHEHKLFLGILPYLSIAVFLYLCWKRKILRGRAQVGFAMISAMLVLMVLTSYWFGFSAYWFAWRFFPGAGGIRGVTRIMVVLLYPSVFIFGEVLSFFLKNRIHTETDWKIGFIVLGVLGLTVVDQAGRQYSVSKRQCERRIAKTEAKIVQAKSNDSDRTVLWINETNSEPFFVKSLDAMLAGQELGMNVVNGYSGLTPKDYPPAMFVLSADCCAELTVWAGTHPGTIANESLLQIGQQCTIPEDYLLAPIKGFSAVEFGKMVHVWAIDRFAELSVPEIAGAPGEEIVSFDLATLKARSVSIEAPDAHIQTVNLIPGIPQRVELRFPSGENRLLKLETDSDGGKPGNGDERTLFFDVENPTVKTAKR
jgi:hypothetical protein